MSWAAVEAAGPAAYPRAVSGQIRGENSRVIICDDYGIYERGIERSIEELQKARLIDHWNALLADTSNDEKSAGGQSLAELDRLEEFERFLAALDGIEIPTFHYFSDGLYMREIHANRDSVIIGYLHQHECLNVMSQGRVLTIANGQVREFVAPCVVKSGAHTRKASIVIEDMRWATVHPNPDNETDIQKLEERFLIKNPKLFALTK